MDEAEVCYRQRELIEDGFSWRETVVLGVF